MRMPEPEEDKVTVTGGRLRASGLLKLGGVRRSLPKKQVCSVAKIGNFCSTFFAIFGNF